MITKIKLLLFYKSFIMHLKVIDPKEIEWDCKVNCLSIKLGVTKKKRWGGETGN